MWEAVRHHITASPLKGLQREARKTQDLAERATEPAGRYDCYPRVRAEPLEIPKDGRD